MVQTHDPLGIVAMHMLEVRIYFLYQHQENAIEKPHKRALTYVEVLYKLI
jgi:hypothetical protein